MTMKPEFMRLRRALAGTVAAFLLAAGIVVLSPALSASAHTPSSSASCTGGLTVDLKTYPKGTTIKVTVDNVLVHDVTLHKDWQNWYANVPWDKTVNHVYQIDVDSPDGKKYDYKKDGKVTGCVPADNPKLSVNAGGCVAYGTTTGTVSYTLSGVNGTYTIELRKNGATVQTANSGAGTGQFTSVAPGAYTVKAKSSHKKVETQQFTVAECAPNKPVIQLVADPC